MGTNNLQEIANYIIKIIRMGAPVSWSWGPAVFRPVEYKGMAALRFSVTGLVHKGDVVVAYHEGADTFEVYCLDRDDAIVASRKNVYLDELIRTIDELVETRTADN